MLDTKQLSFLIFLIKLNAIVTASKFLQLFS